MSFITSKDYLKKDYRYYFYRPLQQENTVKTKHKPDWELITSTNAALFKDYDNLSFDKVSQEQPSGMTDDEEFEYRLANSDSYFKYLFEKGFVSIATKNRRYRVRFGDIYYLKNGERINVVKLDFYKTPDADFLDGLLHRTEDELNRFENSDLIEVTPTGKVNAYGYPIKIIK